MKKENELKNREALKNYMISPAKNGFFIKTVNFKEGGRVDFSEPYVFLGLKEAFEYLSASFMETNGSA